jgi:proteasome assembly chaperone (PAC2) family protein
MLGLTLDRHPDLNNPVLITAFTGWNDAGEAASAAVRWLVRRLPAQRMGRIEAEYYHVLTSTRPTVRNASGERRITWPLHDLYYHHDPAKPRDIVLLIAREPELRWRSYCETVVGVAKEAGVTDLVSLGAWQDRVTEAGVGGSNYEGPTGIVGVLHDFARRADLPSVSLWAAVPQYLPTTANPKAALALMRRVDALLGLGLDLGRLEAAAAYFERQVDEAISRDRRATGYLRALERRSDADPSEPESEPPARLPSADEVIRDLEQFLRSRREGDDD